MSKVKILIDLITYPLRWLIGHLATKKLFDSLGKDAGGTGKIDTDDK